VSARRDRYHRQLLLPDFGAAGQDALERARVLVVGCGGLGTPVVQYLAAAGVGALTLVDDDVVEESNLNRQVLHRQADVGRSKAERAAEWVHALDDELTVRALDERVTTHNARELAQEHDLVVDCTDGLPVKYLLNDACVRERVPLVHGAVTAFAGQVLVVPAGGAPCLRCLFPEIPPPEDVPTCQTAGILGAATGVIGSMMASEALKLLASAPTLSGRFCAWDGLANTTRVLGVPKDARCAACGESPTIDARDPAAYEPACA
jgi:adenylyltransferase/sulfurtransferase